MVRDWRKTSMYSTNSKPMSGYRLVTSDSPEAPPSGQNYFRFILSMKVIVTYWTENVKYKCYAKTANINLQKLTSLNLLFSTTIMTPVKQKISQFKAEKSCQVGFNVLRRFYSWAFVKRVKSSVHVSISFVCRPNVLWGETAQGQFELNSKSGWSVLNVESTVATNTNTDR